MKHNNAFNLKGQPWSAPLILLLTQEYEDTRILRTVGNKLPN